VNQTTWFSTVIDNLKHEKRNSVNQLNEDFRRLKNIRLTAMSQYDNIHSYEGLAFSGFGEILGMSEEVC